VYVVDAVRPEVAPVAVTVFAPPVWSATTVAAPAVHVPYPVPRLFPVVHEKEAVVNMGVDAVTDSPEPKPVTVIDGVTDSSGKPKLAAANVIETFDVTVNAAVPVFVPSDTVTACGPPGRFGTFTSTAKLPTAVVTKHPDVDPVFETMLATGVDALLMPPLVVAQALPGLLSHCTVVVPTLVMMVIAAAGLKPKPSTTKVVPTVPDGAAVRTPLASVDRVTVGPAA